MSNRNYFGDKRSSEVKARVTDAVKFDLQRKCHEIGISESEYIDRLLSISLYGLNETIEADRQKIIMIFGKLAEWAQSGHK